MTSLVTQGTTQQSKLVSHPKKKKKRIKNIPSSDNLTREQDDNKPTKPDSLENEPHSTNKNSIGAWNNRLYQKVENPSNQNDNFLSSNNNNTLINNSETRKLTENTNNKPVLNNTQRQYNGNNHLNTNSNRRRYQTNKNSNFYRSQKKNSRQNQSHYLHDTNTQHNYSNTKQRETLNYNSYDTLKNKNVNARNASINRINNAVLQTEQPIDSTKNEFNVSSLEKNIPLRTNVDSKTNDDVLLSIDPKRFFPEKQFKTKDFNNKSNKLMRTSLKNNPKISESLQLDKNHKPTQHFDKNNEESLNDPNQLSLDESPKLTSENMTAQLSSDCDEQEKESKEKDNPQKPKINERQTTSFQDQKSTPQLMNETTRLSFPQQRQFLKPTNPFYSLPQNTVQSSQFLNQTPNIKSQFSPTSGPQKHSSAQQVNHNHVTKRSSFSNNIPNVHGIYHPDKAPLLNSTSQPSAVLSQNYNNLYNFFPGTTNHMPQTQGLQAPLFPSIIPMLPNQNIPPQYYADQTRQQQVLNMIGNQNYPYLPQPFPQNALLRPTPNYNIKQSKSTISQNNSQNKKKILPIINPKTNEKISYEKSLDNVENDELIKEKFKSTMEKSVAKNKNSHIVDEVRSKLKIADQKRNQVSKSAPQTQIPTASSSRQKSPIKRRSVSPKNEKISYKLNANASVFVPKAFKTMKVVKKPKEIVNSAENQLKTEVSEALNEACEISGLENKNIKTFAKNNDKRVPSNILNANIKTQDHLIQTKPEPKKTRLIYVPPSKSKEKLAQKEVKTNKTKVSPPVLPKGTPEGIYTKEYLIYIRDCLPEEGISNDRLLFKPETSYKNTKYLFPQVSIGKKHFQKLSSRPILPYYQNRSRHDRYRRNDSISWRNEKRSSSRTRNKDSKVVEKTSVELKTAENPFTARKNVDENTKLKNKFNGLLNKLADKNYESISNKFLKLALEKCTSWETMWIVVYAIFEKSLSERDFSSLYSRLTHFLTKNLKTSYKGLDGGTTFTMNFAQMLIRLVQMEFEKGTNIDIGEVKDKNEAIEKEFKLKSRLLGNTKFLGELYMLDILPVFVIFDCIENLITISQDVTIESSIEVLCNLLTTVGKKLDRVIDFSQKKRLDFYYSYLSDKAKRPPKSRAKFLVMDVVDLRNNKWMTKEELAKSVPRYALDRSRTYSAQNRSYESQTQQMSKSTSKYSQNKFIRGNNRMRVHSTISSHDSYNKRQIGSQDVRMNKTTAVYKPNSNAWNNGPPEILQRGQELEASSRFTAQKKPKNLKLSRQFSNTDKSTWKKTDKDQLPKDRFAKGTTSNKDQRNRFAKVSQQNIKSNVDIENKIHESKSETIVSNALNDTNNDKTIESNDNASDTKHKTFAFLKSYRKEYKENYLNDIVKFVSTADNKKKEIIIESIFEKALQEKQGYIKPLIDIITKCYKSKLLSQNNILNGMDLFMVEYPFLKEDLPKIALCFAEGLFYLFKEKIINFSFLLRDSVKENIIIYKGLTDDEYFGIDCSNDLGLILGYLFKKYFDNYGDIELLKKDLCLLGNNILECLSISNTLIPEIKQIYPDFERVIQSAQEISK